MSEPILRSLDSETFDALRGDVLRVAVDLSDEQLLELADLLHGMLRIRRPVSPIRKVMGRRRGGGGADPAAQSPCRSI